MYYATHDSDDLHISENAYIAAFDTREEAEKYLREPWADVDPEEYDGKTPTLQIEPGDFGDCWIKVLKEPHEQETYFAPFKRDEIYIAHPGSHPGGPYYWLSPRADILIARLSFEK